jgi:sRNA-binding protein
MARGRFLSEKFPNCTSETVKARPFQRKQKYFAYLALKVSDVQFVNSLLLKNGLRELA